MANWLNRSDLTSRIPEFIVMAEGRIAWAGPRRELPTEWAGVPEADGGGAWASPGFVDPHTHLLFAGSREGELVLHMIDWDEEADATHLRTVLPASGDAPAQKLKLTLGECDANLISRRLIDGDLPIQCE